MTNYRRAKNDWLKLFKEQAEDRGITVDTSDHHFKVEKEVIGKVRATWNQHPPINLGVSDEVKFIETEEIGGFSHLYLVLLDIEDGYQFDPSTDDFYPIRKSILQNDDWVKQKPSDGRYLLKIDPRDNPIKRWRNDWSLLFSPDSGGSSSGPEAPPANSKVAELQDIAKGLEDQS